MCARYQISVPLELLSQRFKASVPNLFYEAKIDAYPGKDLPIITNKEPESFSFYRWGLVPSWCKDEKIGQKLFNARCETLSEKPSFSSSFLNRRCLVPADSFLEWRDVSGKKVPVKFTLNDNSPFAFAGIYDNWEKEGRFLNTFSIITTTANKVVEEIHDRMPVILRPEHEITWLSGSIEEIRAANIFNPYPSNQMKFELLKR